MNATRDFADLLLARTRHDLWISALPIEKGNRGERHVRTRDADRITQFCEKHDVPGEGVFYCVSSIAGRRRSIENAAETPILWFDIDFKDIKASPDQALEAVMGLPVIPHRIHASGNGLHGIYWLDKPWHGDPRTVLRRLADLVAGDRKVCQPVALMRMPGTHNTKRGEKKLVEVLRHAPGVTTDAAIREMVQGGPVLERTGEAAKGLGGDPYKRMAELYDFKPPIDAEKRLREMEYGGPGDRAVHQTQLQVTASLLSQGVDPIDVFDRVIDATQEIAPPHWNWDREEKAVQGMIDSWLKKNPQLEKKRRRQVPRDVTDAWPSAPHGAGGLTDAEQSAFAARDDDELDAPDNAVHQPNGSGGQVVSLAAVRTEGDPEKTKQKHAHVILGRGLLETLHERGEQMIYEEGQAHRYHHDMWEDLNVDKEKTWLSAEVQAGCDTLELTSRNQLISEVIGWIRRRPELQRKKVDWDGHGKIATRSGLVDPETGELEKIKPEHYATHRLECDYDSTAKCPRLEQLLEYCMPDKKTIEIVQEAVGAALLENKPRKITRGLVFVGPSYTGKSTVIDTIAGFLCDKPSTTPFDMLENAHGTVDFLRPVPWVLHEAFDQSKWHVSATAKALLSGEDIQVNVKNGPLISHRFRQGVFWATNWPPQFREQSRALADRLLIVRMHRQFRPSEDIGADKEAQARGYRSAVEMILDTERSGMLNWALEGLRRLKKRGHFEQTEEMLEAAHEMHLEANLVAGMVRDLIEFDPNMMVSVANFGAAFTSWWRDNRGAGRVPGAVQIGKALSAHDERIGMNNKELRYNSKRFYVGIRINDDGLRAWQQYCISGSQELNTDRDIDLVNVEIPVQWNEKNLIKRMRKAHRECVAGGTGW